MKYRIKNQIKKTNMGICIIIYKIILDFSYVTIISERFDYMGCILNFNALKYIESFFYLMFFIILLPQNEKKYGNIFLQLEFSIMLIPLLSFYALANQNRKYLLCVLVAFIFQIIILNFNIRWSNTRIKKLYKAILVSTVFFTFVVILLSIYVNGFPSLSALNLENTYIIRGKIQTPYGLSYFTDWICKILSPFFMIYSLNKKNFLLCSFFFICSFLMFLIYSSKTYLFILPAIFFVYFTSRKKILLKSIYLGLGGCIAFTSFIYFINNNIIMPVSMITRRFLIIPAMLKFRYYDFFSVNPKVNFADGRIGDMFNIISPYDSPIPIVIRLFYEGVNSSGSANTGYWGDAYANAGFWGVIIISIILAILIKIIEYLTVNTPIEVVVATSVFTILSLNDIAFFTNILSGGMFILFILYYSFDLQGVYRNKALYKP